MIKTTFFLVALLLLAAFAFAQGQPADSARLLHAALQISGLM